MYVNDYQKFPANTLKKAIKELKNENIIKIKPTYHDADIFLNVKMKKEIDEYLNQIDY